VYRRGDFENIVIKRVVVLTSFSSYDSIGFPKHKWSWERPCTLDEKYASSWTPYLEVLTKASNGLIWKGLKWFLCSFWKWKRARLYLSVIIPTRDTTMIIAYLSISIDNQQQANWSTAMHTTWESNIDQPLPLQQRACQSLKGLSSKISGEPLNLSAVVVAILCVNHSQLGRDLWKLASKHVQ